MPLGPVKVGHRSLHKSMTWQGHLIKVNDLPDMTGSTTTDPVYENACSHDIPSFSKYTNFHIYMANIMAYLMMCVLLPMWVSYIITYVLMIFHA